METKRVCPSCQKTLAPNVPLGLCPECLIKSGFPTGTDPENPGKEPGFVPPPVEEIAKLFPQLEVIELIGKGGMGAVYKARQPTLDRFVALKILPPGAADDAGFAERFNREARALARLNHPHIVAVHDFGQAGGQPYLVMEFVDGPNLRQVEQAGRLTPEQALEIVPQICEALQFAHNEGVVHRDIKPENILLDKKGRVKITDFGIAKILGVPAGKVSLTGAKDLLGTPHYMAPEQIEKPQTVDHRADIYSLGVVFYELLTNELPLGKFAPPSKKVQVDVRLDEVVLHTLEKEPDRRYQHASEVKTDVETIAHTSGATPLAPAPALSQAVAESARVEAAWRQVRGPAMGLVITGILNWIGIPLIVMVMAYFVGASNAGKSLLLWVPLMALVFSSVMIVAGLKMKRLEAYGLAVTGAILAMLVTPGNLIGLPIGIWALVALTHREVRAAFGKNHSLPLPSTEAPQPGRGNGAWKVAAVIVAAVMIVLAIPVGALFLAIAIPSFNKARQRAQVVASDSNRVVRVEPSTGGAGGGSSNAALTVAVAAYDVSANYSQASNPNGVWRYGALSNLAGPLTLLTNVRTFGAENGVPIAEWNPGGVLHPHVNKVLGPGTGVSAGGAFVGPAATVYFTPGEDGTAHNFGVIRFTVPTGGAGEYRIVTAVQALFDGAVSADADFHVDKNGVELFVSALGPNQGTSYSSTVALAAGDTIDFAIGRGADGVLGTTGLKIQATVAQLTGAPGGIAPTITSHPQNRTVTMGGDAATLAQQGWQLWQGGRPAEAIPKFESAVKLDPKNSAAWNGLGWASFNSGKTAEAEKAFRKVIELEPDHAAALNGLGQIYLAQKNYIDAESYLLKASPKASAAWYGLARLYLLQGKFEEAEKWAQNIVDSGQVDEGARLMLQAARDKKLSEGLRRMIEPQ